MTPRSVVRVACACLGFVYLVGIAASRVRADSGNYTTAVPIAVPSFHGIAPHIGLAYHSQGGNSSVGTGWILQAGSQIERVSRGRGTPRYDDSQDIFLLDGAELVPCAGSNSPSPSCMPAVGGTYFGRVENYLKIVHNTTASTWAVWAKDGTKSTYVQERPTLNFQTLTWTTTRRWLLSSVRDSHGNHVDYHYSDGVRSASQPSDVTADIYLDSITYAEGSACEDSPPCTEPPGDLPTKVCGKPYKRGDPLPGAEIKFFWEDRPDPISFGDGHGLADTGSRLKSIRIMNAGRRVGVFVLQHSVSAVSGRSLVNSVKQYGNEASVCDNPNGGCYGTPYGEVLPFNGKDPAHFEPVSYISPAMNGSANQWATDSDQTLAIATQTNGYSSSDFSTYGVQMRPDCRSGDINADGRDDYVCIIQGPAAIITMAIAKAGGGFFWANRQIVPNITVPKDWLLTDMTGDGRADVAAFQSGKLVVWPSDPNISVPCNFWAPDGSIGSCAIALFNPNTAFGFSVTNGPWSAPSWPASTYVPPNHDHDYDGILGDIRIDSHWIPPEHNENRDDYWFTGDINGDGKADFIYLYRNTATNTLNACAAMATSDIHTFNLPVCQLNISMWYDRSASRSRFFPADINGDGKMDLVHIAYHPGNIEQAPNNFDHDSIETFMSKGDGGFLAKTYHRRAPWLADSDWMPGDINGDGKTDLIQKVREPATGGGVDYAGGRFFTSLGNGEFQYFAQDTLFNWNTHCASQKEARWLVADFNGDGRDDLGSGYGSGGSLCNTPTDKTTRFHVAQSLPHDKCANTVGCFRMAFNYHSAIGSSDDMPPRVGDFNGDGKADLLVNRTVKTERVIEPPPYPYAGVEDPFGTLPPPEQPTVITEVNLYLDQFGGKNNSNDLRTATTLELDGDGREDYVRVFFRKPGYTIFAYRREPGYGYFRTETQLSPGDFPEVTPLNNPDTGAWMAADVGGSAAPEPDGKEDLVYVDSDADAIGFGLNYVTGVHIYTLLSDGAGQWIKRLQTLPITIGGMQANRSFDTLVNRRWKLIDIDADGRSDLVYTSFENGQMKIYSLLSNGDGTWTTAPVTTLAGFAGGDERRWMVGDANGDGRTDLLFAKPVGVAGTTSDVFTLFSDFSVGRTSWTLVTTPSSFTFQDALNWRAADMNGDGLTDLVFVSKAVGVAGVTLNELLSNGDGRYTARTLGPYTPPLAANQSILGFDDVQNFKFADPNGDGKVDALFVTSRLRANGIQAGVFSLMNHYPAVVPLYQELAGNAFNFPDTKNWFPMDAKNNDGRSDLVYMAAADPTSGATSPVMSILALNAATDRMSLWFNGLMGKTAITYKTSVGLHTNLPAGSLWNILDKVAQTDLVKSVTYISTYTYAGARWSYPERLSLGFASAEERGAKAKTVTFYDQTVDLCGPRPSAIIRETLAGNVLSQFGPTYVPAGTAAPYLCLTAQTYSAECDGLTPPPAANCATRRGETVYDAYGNVTEAYDRGLQADLEDDRRQVTVYHPNLSAYLVELPASSTFESYNMATGGWDRQSQRFNIYDQPTGLDDALPPGTLGEIKKVLVWNSATAPTQPTDRIATAFDYDSRGNLTKTTGPTGITETATFECNYKRFPESLCNSLGQCAAQTREFGRDLITSNTGYNAGDTTRFTYDALARPFLTLKPDGGYVVHAYLDFGKATQRVMTVISDGSSGVLGGVYWAAQYFDGLGRNYLSKAKGVTGAPADDLSSERTFEENTNWAASESAPHTAAETPIVTALTYDAWRRPTLTTNVSTGRSRKLVYSVGNPQALPRVVSSLRTYDENNLGREYFRDIFGRVVRVREYDRECTYVNNDRSCGKTNTYDTTYDYDPLDRLTRITDSLSHTSTDAFNSLGWKMQSADWDLGTSSFDYRLDGLPAKETDARGFSKTYGYDPQGRGVIVKHLDNANPPVVKRTITSSYDHSPAPPQALQGASLGHLTQVSDVTADYAGCFEVSNRQFTTPVGTRTDNTLESCLEAAKAAGWAQAGLQDGGLCFGGANVTGRLKDSECDMPCTANAAQICGAAKRLSVYATAGLHTVIDRATYDLMGRPQEQTRCIDGPCATMSQTYNKAGQVASLTYPDGEVLTLAYNGTGQLTRLGSYLTATTYTSQGRPTLLTYGNGVTTTYSYDPNRFWPTSMSVSAGGYAAAYTYDFGGRMRTRSQINPPEAVLYQYDDLDRLRKVSSAGPLAQDFEYDRIGNMTLNSKMGTYAYADPAHAHAVTQVTGAAPRSFTYDAVGNMTSAGAQSYPQWNHDSRLMQANAAVTAQYSYDAAGLRVTKTVGPDTTRYFSRFFELSAAGQGTKYYFAGQRLVAKRDPAPAPVVATSLTFSWAVAACGGGAGPHDVDFYVNNQSIFPPPALWALPVGGCPGNCTTQVRQVTITNPAILSLVNNPTGPTVYKLRLLPPGHMIAWAKVAINVPNQAPRELVIFDYRGGGDAEANNTVICGTPRGPQAVNGPGSWSVTDPAPASLVNYFHSDHLGSTRVRSNATGQAVGTPTNYAAFGQATPGLRFGYALAESDDETGLLNMEARYQSPDIGRMISADDIVPNVFNPQSLNRYSYGLNNPVMYNDPTGHDDEKPGGADGRTTTVHGTRENTVPWQLRPWSNPGGNRPDINKRPPGHDIQVGIKPAEEPKAPPPVRANDPRAAHLPVYEDPEEKKARLEEEEAERNKSIWNLFGSASAHSVSVCPPNARGACVEFIADPATGKMKTLSGEIEVVPNFMKGKPHGSGGHSHGPELKVNVGIPVGENNTFQTGAEAKAPLWLPGVGSVAPGLKLEGTADVDTADVGLETVFTLEKSAAGVAVKSEYTIFELGTGHHEETKVGPPNMSVWKNSGGNPNSIWGYGPPPKE